MRTGAISIVAGLGMALGALAADPAMAQRPHETMGGRMDGSTFPVTTRPAPVMAPGLFPGPVPAPGPVPTPGPAPLPPGTPGFGARRFDPHQAQGAHRDRDRRRGQPGVVYVL